MKPLYFFLLLVLFSPAVYSQYYTRDSGVRFGEGFFGTYRQFYNEEKALEGMAGFSKNGFRAIILREHFTELAKVHFEGLKFVYGYGLHAGINYTNSFSFLNRTYYYKEWKWSPQFGVDGMAGFEYTLPEFPLLIQLVAQPYFEYSLYRFFQVKAFNFIISFKYRF
jgi:hypothetical protein